MSDIITVAVPIFNSEAYLEFCLESIVNQSYKNLQILLINDGSTDDSLKICENYAAIDKRIQIITKKNSGVGSARNTAIRNANGDYFIYKDYIKKLYSLCKNNDSEISIIDYKETDSYSIDTTENRQVFTERLTNIESLNRLFEKENSLFIIPCGKLYKLNLFKDNEIFYPENVISDDEGTTYKLFYYSKKIMFSNEKLYYYVNREDSLTKSKFEYRRLTTLRVFKDRYLFFEKQNDTMFKMKSLKGYVKILIDYYCSSKKYLKDRSDYKKIINQLRIETKKYCIFLLKNYRDGLSTSQMIKVYINSISPNIYYIIFVIKHLL